MKSASIAAFAKEQGIGDGRLRFWRDRLRDVAASEAAKVETRSKGLELVRVEIPALVPVPRHADAARAWEIITPRGQLRVHESIGADELRVVLRALVGEEVAK